MSKLGIIVPYRDRYEHLKIFKQSITQYLNKNLKNKYSIIIVEQDNASAFNRGMLCNIGFLEAEKQKCNYVVFHDVDMIPTDVDYSYSNKPIHLAPIDDSFESYFGGITLFPSKSFRKVDGFSNMYWGWGFEDDDLRYRCVKSSIPFYKREAHNEDINTSAIFNGVDSFALLPNVLNFNRDFELEIELKLDRMIFDPNKPSDKFNILTIKGCDLTLEYNSFNRFNFSLFDKDINYYDITSNIVIESKNKITIKFYKSLLKLEMFVNDIPQGVVELKAAPYKYSFEKVVYIGSTPDKANFFKGGIDCIKVSTQNKVLAEFRPGSVENYSFVNTVDNKNNGEVFSVYFDKFIAPVNYYSFIPFRRESKIKLLNHESNGYIGGRWKSDLTRWNQLRYNNEVQNGGHDNLKDGLSTCSYTLHNRVEEKNITHLTIGI